MARHAIAQARLSALRREIARIEGSLAGRLAMPAAPGGTVLRQDGRVAEAPCGLLATGAARFDAALGGGIAAGLTEIHGRQMREAGAAAGFALGLAGLALAAAGGRSPLLWVGTREVAGEAGLPYAPALAAGFGIGPDRLLVSLSRTLVEALRVAGEAASLAAFAAVLVEVRGNPARLDLTATRRLHRHGLTAGRPVFLLRQAGCAEPTAAPFRFDVAPAASRPRLTLAGPLARSIGPPAFAVGIGKGRTARAGRFVLEWDPGKLSFEERRQDIHEAENNGAVAALSGRGAGAAPAARTLVAFRSPGGEGAAPPLLPGGQRPARRRA